MVRRAHAAAPADAPGATIDGEPAAVEAALARAAELLRGARRPLLYGFDAATVEDARAAVALADRLGALVMTDERDRRVAGRPGAAAARRITATLGEIRDRSRVVVIWREDPEATHPRLLERLGFGGDARAASRERTLVVVDDRDTATAQRADLRLRGRGQRDLEALVTLHALQRELAPAPSDLDAASWTSCWSASRTCPMSRSCTGPALTGGDGGQRRALALHELIAGAQPRAPRGDAGADRAPPGPWARRTCWPGRPGTPAMSISPAGHPELVTATQPLDDAEGIDVALRIEGAPASWPPAWPRSRSAASPRGRDGAEVSIRTAAAGVDAAGTAHRLDGVPLTLQAPLAGDAPTAAALLTRLLAEVAR